MSASPRERALRRAKTLKRLAEELDALRALKLFDTASALRALDELELRGETWDELRGFLRFVASIPSREPYFLKVRRMDRVSNYLLLASFAMSLTSLASIAVLHSDMFAYLLIIAALILLNAAYVLKLYVLAKLKSAYASHLDEIKGGEALLKKAVEQTLAKMRGELRKAGATPSSVVLDMHFSDYSQVRVMEKKRGRYKLALK
uniref:Uncharacterized protein n=1 Tax=Thermofilum pendens TaxID=2269 RepID=A0A7C1T0Z7_THEPE